MTSFAGDLNYLQGSGAAFVFGTTGTNNLRIQTNSTDRITFSGSANGMTFAEGFNITLGTATGTLLGAAANNKLGIWGATPIVQPTTAVAAATFVANTSGIVNDTATFDGYTIGQVVKALRNAGLLA